MTHRQRPEVHPPGPWSFPPAQHLTLPHGVDVVAYHRPGQHVISAGLNLEIPLTAEPASLEGVATLCFRALDEGTKTHHGTEFAEAVERCGAALDGQVTQAATQLFLDVPSSHLADGLRLLAEAVREPTLTDADIDRHRTLRLAQIDQQLADSGERAGLALRQALYKRRFRAARSAHGEASTVARVSGADARSFHADFYGPRGSTLVLAGDFPPGWQDAVADAFGAWQNPHQVSAPHEVPRGRRPRAFVVDRPGSVQADIRLGQVTIDRQDPRWADLQIATYCLGGAFLSRLNRVLREERGFTYGASLSNAPLRHRGHTTMAGSFRTDVVGEALDLIPSLLDTSTAPFTDDEIDRARTYLLGVNPLQYATASGVCSGVMTLVAAGLTSDFIDATRDAYRRVTPASATAVAQELLSPGGGSLVVVGDAAALAPGVAAAGWDAEVVPLTASVSG